jgi:hypothetical protein
MAADKKKLEEISSLLDQIQKNYNKLGEKSPFSKMDPNKVKDVDNEILKLEVSLQGVQDRVSNLDMSFNDLTQTLKAVVQEITKSDTNLQGMQKGMRGLVKEANKLADEEADIALLSKKQLNTMLERAEKSKKMAQDNAKAVLADLGIRTQAGKVMEKDGLKIGRMKKKEREKAKAALSILQDQGKFQQAAIDGIKKRIILEDKFNRRLGLAGQLAGGLDNALQKAGLPALGIADAIDQARKNFVKTNGKSSVFLDTTKGIAKNLFKALSPANLITGAFTLLSKSLLEVDKASGEFAKNNGISYNQAVRLRGEMSKVALNLENINISSKDLMASQENLNKIFGSSVVFSDKMTSDFAELTKLTKMTAETAEVFAKEAFSTGKGAKVLTKEFNTQVFELNRQKGLQMSAKQLQDAIGKSSKSIQLTFKGSSKELANQVTSAKALGTNLSGVEKIAESLLDFESSIQSEMEAELLLGKNINLEKARQAAMEGDMAKVADEVLKNQAIMQAFNTKNVLAQRAAAKSLGMSKDELANMINEQQKLEMLRAGGSKSMEDAQERYNELRNQGLTAEQAAEEIGAKSLKDQLESVSAAEKLEAIMVRVQEVFVQLATPILDAISGTGKLELQATRLANTIKGIAITYGVIKAAMFVIRSYQAAQLVASTRALAVDTARAGAAVTAASASTLGIGAVSIIAGIAAVMGAVAGYIYANDAVMPGGKSGYGDRVLLGPEGAISFNNKDTIVAGTNLFADDMAMAPEGSINMDAGNNKMIEKMDKLIEKTEDLISVTMGEKAVRLEDGSLLGQLISYQGRRLQ